MPDTSNYVCVNKEIWNAVLSEHFKMFTQLKKQSAQRQATQAKYYLHNKDKLSGKAREYYQNVVKMKQLFSKSLEMESDSE